MKIRITADSTCDLSREILAKYDIRIIPLYIIMGDENRRDGVDCTKDDIYAYVERTGKLCSTSAVTIADYMEIFGAELETHNELVHFTISSDMSACYQNACAAAELFGDRVFVVDSRNLSAGIGQLAMDAVLLAREGKTGREIKTILDEKKKLLNVSFVLDTLRYLHKGGRCSAVAALGANLLNLKPCIEVRDGAMGVGKKYRGTLDKTFRTYIRDRLEGHDDIDYHRIFITDSGVDRALAAELMDILREMGPFEEIWNTQSQGTISNHCGPNCLGILYYNK